MQIQVSKYYYVKLSKTEDDTEVQLVHAEFFQRKVYNDLIMLHYIACPY